jgi:undecaprenyl-diphosphatase
VTSLEALVLGLVQGLTEFLPISSSGHLVIVPRLFGWEQPSVAFDVMLHAASLIAVLIYFRRELIEVLAGFARRGPGRRFIWLLVIGTIPAALIGFFLEEPLSQMFDDPVFAAITLMGTGVILVVSEVFARARFRNTSEEGDVSSIPALAADISFPKSFAIGCAQAVSIIPGISRSGATIGTGLLTGMSRPQAARFSFMLAVPILIGVSVYKVPDLSGAEIGPAAIIIGFLASLVSSYAAVAGMIGYLQKRGLYPFAIYCFVVGLVLTLLWS